MRYVTQDGRCPYSDSNRPRYELQSVKLQLEQSCAVSMEQYCKHTNYGRFYFTAHALKAQK
jgi:hypothetical protein